MILSMLKIVSLCCLLGIVYQDFKERQVYLWLFICTGIVLSSLFLASSYLHLYLINIGMNSLGVLLLILMLFIYTKYKLKIQFEEGIGLGDLLFFLCIAISFPITTFIILFTFSLCFAAIVFLFIKPLLPEKTIPLAGLQAAFLFLIISINWGIGSVNLYTL